MVLNQGLAGYEGERMPTQPSPSNRYEYYSKQVLIKTLLEFIGF